MNPQLQTILSELKTRLTELYGERLEKLVLFGSQARGDAEPDSDIDVLVVLNGEVDVGKELWAISGITSDLTINHGLLVSTVVMPTTQYYGRRSGFLSNVQNEGRAI